MNVPEFKAWFEGFTENMNGPPDEKAWKRICEKIAEIGNDPARVAMPYLGQTTGGLQGHVGGGISIPYQM